MNTAFNHETASQNVLIWGTKDEQVSAPQTGLDSSEIARFGAQDEFVLKMAVTEEDRLKAWQLVYQTYLTLGYARPQELELRYSLHDAVPDTATFLIETNGQAIATVTVFPDSPLGFPAEEMYRTELDALRQAGRKPVEIGRLVIRQDHVKNHLILMNMMDALSLYARCLRHATDLVITVNPGHAKFYELAILFKRIGEQRELGSVCGAPAVLLRLDLALELMARRYTHGEGVCPNVPIGRHTVYPHLSGQAEEIRRVARMRQCLRQPDASFIRRHFQHMIARLAEKNRALFEAWYPNLLDDRVVTHGNVA